MLFLCIHSDDIETAYNIGEDFCNSRKVKDPPEIMYKVQTYILPGGKRETRRSYLTSIKIGN